MKQFLLSLGMVLMVMFSNSQINNGIPLLGDKASSFQAESTQGPINFPDDYYGKWVILFSHPADFTPVCSTEMLELADMYNEFIELNTYPIVISTDRLNSHLQWVKSLENIDFKGKGKVRIEFPIIADPMLEVSKKYGMIQEGSSNTHTVRAVYIINPENKVCAIFYYPTNVGRNLTEIKRTLLALQLSEKKDILTPANWLPGEDVLIPGPKTVDEAKELEKKEKKGLYSFEWYMWFKKL